MLGYIYIYICMPFFSQIRAHKDIEGKGGGKRLILRQESQGGILTGNLSSGSQRTFLRKTLLNVCATWLNRLCGRYSDEIERSFCVNGGGRIIGIFGPSGHSM